MFTKLFNLTFPVPVRKDAPRRTSVSRRAVSASLLVTLAVSLQPLAFSPLRAQTQQLDFGDAPQPYPTLLDLNGARHVITPNFYLGARVDAEPDGQPNATATGDDNNPATANDEDGVLFTTPLIPGQSATVQVTATMPVGSTGRLDAWIDFNANGSWADPDDAIFVSVILNPGVNTLNFTVPPNAAPGRSYARFRLTRNGFPQFFGLAPDGEVEDYQVTIGNQPQQPRCDESCKGTDFWLTFPGNYAPDPANPPQVSLSIIGSPGTTGTASIASLGVFQNFTIPASKQVVVSLPSAADLGNANDLIEDKGIHVTAVQPVGINGLNRVVHTSEGYLALPTSVLGTDYVVQAFANVNSGIPPLNGTQFAIVASASNTTVTITPSTTTGTRDEAIAYNIVLQAGQTYQLRNTNDAPADLSGTIITSDKPIAVFGSHRCASVNSSDIFFCDYLVEQLLPVRSWGTDFVAALFATRSSGDTFRFLAATDGTAIFVNGTNVALLNRGESSEMIIGTSPHITASHPISVAQYANSSDYDGVVNADPLMVIVPPTKFFNPSQVVCTAPAGFTAHYINVVAPTSVTGFVQIDGASIGPFFAPIPTSTYSGAQVAVPAGVHTVSAPQPVGVTVYGWAPYDAYGWPGCLYFGDVTPPAVACNAQDMTFFVSGDAAGGCTAQVPDLRQRATATDNCTDIAGLTIQQSPQPGTFLGPGSYPITVSATDPSGNVGSCFVTMTVIDPSAPTIVCPRSVEANCAEGGQLHPQVRVVFNVSARTSCITNLPVQCQPPSGSFFPIGTTTVICLASNNNQFANCSFLVNVCSLSVTRPAPGIASFTWASGGTLEHAPTVTGLWTPLSNAISPYQITIDPQQPAEFYRVKY